MPFYWNPREHLKLGRYALKWLCIAIPVGCVIGSAVALFLWALERATETRWNHPWLLYLLPLAGVAVGAMYQVFGKSVEAGNNLIVDQIHTPGGGVPSRMAPLVLIGTVTTHLFGGSAGREGTAIQMGGSISATVGRWLRLNVIDTQTLLMCGVAAGFGSVFGTPLTGAVFAIEVLAIGLLDVQAIIPCLIASIAGDRATRAWGIQHTAYRLDAFAQLDPTHPASHFNLTLLLKIAVAAIAFGLASVLFAELTHGLHKLFRKWVRPAALCPALGGIIVILLAWGIGPDYLGLDVTAPPLHPEQVSIVSCFRANGAGDFSWLWKILFTAVTLSSGFKGGEVTPLFFIGAALGNVLGRMLHAPVDLFAAAGFVAVFAGATNTPLACTIMGIELFGNARNIVDSGLVIDLAVACFVAYLFSGHSGIYLSQRIKRSKGDLPELEKGSSLRSARN